MQITRTKDHLNMPETETAWHLHCTWHATSSPSTLVLHRAGRDRSWWARESHASMGVDDRNDFPCAHSSGLLVTHLIQITVQSRWDIGVGRSRRQGDRWGDLLRRLDLMLQRRRIRRSAGKRRPIRTGRMDGMQLREMSVTIDFFYESFHSGQHLAS
jgi:hypothetical protein